MFFCRKGRKNAQKLKKNIRFCLRSSRFLRQKMLLIFSLRLRGINIDYLCDLCVFALKSIELSRLDLTDQVDEEALRVIVQIGQVI